ncbi:MAG TPA: hypothetical protein VHG88_10360 [Burkholderiales bacterium]|nr:hypothetical protein [Burkholderiales bacterium]
MHRLSGAVDVRNRYTETLQFAAATIGGAARLARFLNVPRSDVLRWLAGEEAPPDQVFLDALDVIADGPYADPERRRIRVSVLPPR